jgi:hypothetical protein
MSMPGHPLVAHTCCRNRSSTDRMCQLQNECSRARQRYKDVIAAWVYRLSMLTYTRTRVRMLTTPGILLCGQCSAGGNFVCAAQTQPTSLCAHLCTCMNVLFASTFVSQLHGGVVGDDYFCRTIIVVCEPVLSCVLSFDTCKTCHRNRLCERRHSSWLAVCVPITVIPLRPVSWVRTFFDIKTWVRARPLLT